LEKRFVSGGINKGNFSLFSFMVNNNFRSSDFLGNSAVFSGCMLNTALYCLMLRAVPGSGPEPASQLKQLSPKPE